VSAGLPPALDPLPKAELPHSPDGQDRKGNGSRPQDSRSATLIVEGNPPDQIRRVASTGDYDLIAMATHGRTGFQSAGPWEALQKGILHSSPIPIFRRAEQGR